MTPTAVELPWAIVGAPGMSLLDREHETTPAQFGFGSPRDGGTAAMTEVWLRASLTHDIIDQAQYSYLIAAVIGSAAVPTFGGERVLRATIPAADGGDAVDGRAGA